VKNVIFHFKGFDPNDQLKEYVGKKCETLFRTVPSDAFPKGFVEKKDDHYVGTVEVVSAQGNFSVEAKGDGPEEVFTSLYDSLKDKLNGWHKKRFL